MRSTTTIGTLCLIAYAHFCHGEDNDSNGTLLPCGDAYYYPTKVHSTRCGNWEHPLTSQQYTCYDTNFLCPILNGQPTLRCGSACYLPNMYSCSNDELVYPPTSSASSTSSSAACTGAPNVQHLSSPPYEDYFYSDCHSASQVVVTSPLADSNLTIIGPRIVVAWPAGNSGVVAFFAPQNGVNGSLAIELVNGTAGQPLAPIYIAPNLTSLTGDPQVGISTLVKFNSSAALTVPIMGSIRTIRDFTEGPSLLEPVIQDAIKFATIDDGGAMLSRLWLDNATTVHMSFVPATPDSEDLKINNRTLELAAGLYNFTATFDYPQLTQLSKQDVLAPASQGLITQQASQTTSLSFLANTTKLLAGAWRFLTYFGRDSMITLLLMQPVLSEGEGGAIEAVIGAVLERLNSTSGQVCHEETIGDYATYENSLMNVSSTKPSCTYIMVDTDYYLAPVMENYFLKTAVGQSRRDAFFAQKATLDFNATGLLYSELALRNAERVMTFAAPFAAAGGQTQENLIHLLADQIVGDWRDSTYGIGGGRIPYDVNTGLVPAALRSVAALSAAGLFPQYPSWSQTALEYAEVWETETLQFFEVTVPAAEAQSLVTSYAKESGYGIPSEASNITSDVTYHGLSLDGYNDQSIIKVMNTDDCFRLYLLNGTNQTQLTSFINQTASHIRQPYPVGLSTPLGLLIANPAYGGDTVYATNWTTNAYQGTVIWSWPMAMMAAGLERQLLRCSASGAPDFCSDAAVHENVVAAYHHLWDLIDANTDNLGTEVWSWEYENGAYEFVNYGSLPPPPGSSPTESDIVQLWSLTFLAVTRNPSL